MSSSLDFQILPILRQEGQILPDIPGLHIAKPPRRVDRRRASEQLVFHLTLQGNAPLSLSAYQQLLRGLVNVYYRTPGPSTSAMQKVTEALNNYLRDRNMRGASRSLRAVGLFTQIVLRDNTAYIAQSGPTHLFHIKPDESLDYHDIEMSGRGLGISRIPKVRFHHQPLTENDLLLVTAEPPPIWTAATLKNLSRMQMKSRYHRLLHRLEDDVNAVLLMTQPGSGEVRIMRPKLADEEPAAVDEAPIPEHLPALEESPPPGGVPSSVGAPSSVGGKPLAGIPKLFGKSSTVEETSPPERQPFPAVETAPTRPPSQPEGVEKSPKFDFKKVVSKIPLGSILGKTWAILATIGSAIGNAFRSAASSAFTLIKRALPDEEMLDVLPAWLPGFIAVAVPIMLVVAGSVVYAEKRGSGLFESNYEQALVQYDVFENSEDEGEKYQSLRVALESLEKAHIYGETEESTALYEQIKAELDVLDNVTRLAFRPLLEQSLGNDVHISEIVFGSFNDIYLLNSTTGKVIRLEFSNGYKVDEEFQCGPVPVGHVKVGKLVDIIPLDGNRVDEAVILGIDAAHVMILCTQAGGDNNNIFQDTSYTLSKGEAVSMTLSSGASGDIYILSPQEQLIFVEYAQEDYRTGAVYFGEGGVAMTDAIDLATNGGELFMLHNDGHITHCIKQGVLVAPICDSPYNFSNVRPGQEPVPTIEGANFSSIKFWSRLGMRVYLLDSEQQAVYAFSPNLEYLGRFHPSQPLMGGDATAFSVFRHKEIYLAVGGQIYVAEIGE